MRGLSFAAFDIARFQSAVGQTGGRSISSTTEPINALSRRFFADMSVAQAAAEAALDPKEFQARIARSERLLGLGYGQLLVENGGLRRDAWDGNFGDLTQELQLGDYVASIIVLSPPNR